MKIFKSEAQAKKDTGLSYIGTINSSAKIVKNKKVSMQYTYIIYLAPAETSGYQVCSHSTPECRMGCLATSGRAGIEIHTGKSIIRDARIKKTRMLFENTHYFMEWVIAEMHKYQRKAKKDGYGFSVRLNGTSDINWQIVRAFDNRNLFETFPDVQFYDYTKVPSRFENKPANYHLTFSYTGHACNAKDCLELLAKGQNVAVVFDVKKGQPLPKKFMGYKVIDGDLTDYRPNDGKGVIVGLRFKRIANKENANITKNSRFVVMVDTLA
jgi:hypothetical protein